MNRFLTAILTTLLLGSFSAIIAQDRCGTSFQSEYDLRERMFQNRIDAANQETATSRDVTVYVPIKFHIVSKSDGSLGIPEPAVLDLLCDINTYYEDQDMVFYIDYPFSYISNSSLFDDASSLGALFQIQANWDDSALNLFLTGSAGPGVAGYYSAPSQAFPYERIIIQKSSIGGVTAPHELGHFFSLAHPFFGWGQAGETGWDPMIHDNPVGPNSPVNDNIPNEKMDGSNCLQAGDGICDTPPDYFFATSPLHDGDCSWEGNAMDPNGTVVVTMENNVMNYFNGCGTFVFTQDQEDAIRSDYNSNARAYLRHSYVPNTNTITEAPVLAEPINGEVTAGYNLVHFDWNTISGAQYYLLEIDQQPTFNFLPKRFLVSGGSSIEIEDVFNPSTLYYWRVTPWNDGNTCDIMTSSPTTFTTGNSVSTKNIDIVNEWSVIPNPVRQNQKLNIQLEADQSFDATIRLYSVTGQLIKNVSKHNFAVGASNYDFDISGVNTGMYILAIQSERGVINKKIVISE